MKAIAVNGSPRKGGNTAALLAHALRGAAQNGAKTRLVHLYELNFKGCTSCFACKRKGSRCNGLCAVKDELTGVLADILACDALFLGSPVYFGNVTGEMRSFLERLIFPNHSYNTGDRSLFHGKMASAFFYTMNVTKEQMEQMDYEALFKRNQALLQLFRGESEIFASSDTYQFDDYSLYDASRYDEGRKARVRAERFPLDCQRAFELGLRLTKGE